MSKKYELTDESIEHDGHILYRIKAIRDFYRVKKGYLGGYVEYEDNLSQEGECWLFDRARVYEGSRISGGATVYDNAQVCGRSRVYGRTHIYQYAKVSGEAIIKDNARIYGKSNLGVWCCSYIR
jgi:NDP-sugar pyrophosphorylase family protein